MKLIIQIPCFNEAESLPATLADLPRQVDGFDIVEWLVVDDGSTDDTVRVARECGADHVVRHTHNRGLARAFMTGIGACLARKADVIVNTDADNQYDASCIPDLVRPILEGSAEVVIGARPIGEIEYFSSSKKLLQQLGSWIVRVVSRTKVPDAPSGFRAITSSAAQQLVVFNDYTYTLETIIQAGQNNVAIKSVPIRVNPDLRPSRLISSIPTYLLRSLMTVVRIFVVYRPFRFFGTIALVFVLAGTFLGLRFLWYLWQDPNAGHVQSLILAAILIGAGFNTILTAFVTDLLAANRKLSEEIRVTVHKINSLREKDEEEARNQ
jgi:glycosyltransferase involved in cell wall biosynthesis